MSPPSARQVAATMAAESAYGERPAPPLLDSVSAISTEWLQQALRAGGHELPPFELHAESLGAGNFGAVARLHLRYRDASPALPEAELPRTLICKFSAPLPQMHAIAVGEHFYPREAAAYQELSRHSACRLAHLYYAAADAQRLNLVIEDLGGRTQPGDLLRGCTRQQVSAVLAELASLHGCFAQLSPASAPLWLVRMRQGVEGKAELYRDGVAIVDERFGDQLAPEHLGVIAAFADLLPDWHRYERQAKTFTHGDPRPENVRFAHEGARVLATLVNWQRAGLRNPMYDVAALLTGTLPVETRRSWERELLAEYCQAFERSGMAYPLREALEDFRFNLFSALSLTVGAVARLPRNAHTERQTLTMLIRQCTAILDWEAMSLLRQRTGVATATLHRP